MACRRRSTSGGSSKDPHPVLPPTRGRRMERQVEKETINADHDTPRLVEPRTSPCGGRQEGVGFARKADVDAVHAG